ncbi:MAG: TolC family protein [Candidatus Baltobacteraceae bacterium]
MTKTRALSALVAAAALATALLPLQRISAEPAAKNGPAHATAPTPVPSAVLPIVPSVAPGYEAPKVAPTAATIVGVTQQPFVGIALADAIGMALLKNPNLAVSASNTRIAAYQIIQAKGAFDVNFKVEPTSSFSLQPPQNLFFSGPGFQDIVQNQSTLQYGVGGQTVNGTQYTAGIQQSRTFNNTGLNAFAPFYPYYLASLNVAVTQPLLRNAGMNAPKRQLKVSSISADASDAQALVDSSNTISQVSDAYWSLVAAWRNVAIQEDALKEAIVQQASVVRLAKRGAAAPIDAVESSTQVSTFQDNVFSALESVSEIQNNLKGLIVANPADPIWSANLVPTTSVLQLPTAPDLAAVVREAMVNRPEVRQAADQKKIADVNVKFAKNQALPQLDFLVTVQSNGFAGIPYPLQPSSPLYTAVCNNPDLTCPTPPPNTQGQLPWAYHNMWAFAFPTYNFAILLTQPLQGNLVRGLKGQASEQEHQAQLLMQGVAERISFDARNALQSYESALSRLSASSQARQSADAVYQSEVRKFHNGSSTTFLVLQRQVQLNQARARELLAQTDLNKAVVELQRVEGTLLTENGVTLQTLGSKALAP